MINLIPIEEKKRIKRDFYLRLSIVFLFALIFSLFISTVSISPSLFFSSMKKNLADQKLESFKKQPMPTIDQETSEIIKDLDDKLNLIEKVEKDKFLVSEKVINKILSEKMLDIKITRISYATIPLKGKKISIYGFAPNRERLLSFRKALENNPFFSKVDLPISNFIKGSNIEFNLDLIPI